MQLAHRYIVAFLLVVVVSGGVLFAMFDAHRSDVTDNTEASVEDRAGTMAVYLDSELGEQQKLVEFASTNPSMADHRSQQQLTVLESFVETTSFDGVSVVDESGTVQALVTRDGEQPGMAGESLGNRTYVQQALDGERYISEPFQAGTGNFVVVISAPVTVDGDVVGAVNGAYHLNETHLFEQLLTEDEDTAVTVHSDDLQLYSNVDKFDETVEASADLETVNWTVIAHHDLRAVQKSVDRLLLSQGLLGLVLLGVLVTFGGWVYRGQIVRISHLLDNLRVLKRREYDSEQELGGTTEWEQIEEALRELRDALNRREQMLLVHNRILRHNLRNKLNVIQSRAEILETELDADVSTETEEIRKTAMDLLQLAERARASEMMLDPPPDSELKLDVAGLVHNVATVMEEREPSLTVNVTAPVPVYAACDVDFGNAVEELLQNVVDHTGPQPTATVAVTEADECVVIRVEDDGEGIPDEEAAIVSGDRDITQMHHTVGIGLWLVDWIVARYDGTLRIPQSPNAGGVVEITLPRAETE